MKPFESAVLLRVFHPDTKPADAETSGWFFMQKQRRSGNGAVLLCVNRRGGSASKNLVAAQRAAALSAGITGVVFDGIDATVFDLAGAPFDTIVKTIPGTVRLTTHITDLRQNDGYAL